MQLLTTFFEIDIPERLAEFRFCIETLCALNIVERYHVFFEGDIAVVCTKDEYKFLQHPKINLIQVKERPTYRILIDYANVLMPFAICGIINADIYFDEGMQQLAEAPMDNRFYAITRIHNGEHQNPGSQDLWVFRTPLHFSPAIYMGVNGCDSFLAQKALEAGYSVINPCLTIHIYHKHFADYNHKPFTLASGDYWAAPGYQAVEIPYSNL